MQILNAWSELAQLALPQNVKAALIAHLTEPFSSPALAKAFWQENSVHLLITDPPEDAVPEYTEALLDDYIIQLVITNNSGGDNYYVSKGGLKSKLITRIRYELSNYCVSGSSHTPPPSLT